jgi:hypothetical protein
MPVKRQEHRTAEHEARSHDADATAKAKAKPKAKTKTRTLRATAPLSAPRASVYNR